MYEINNAAVIGAGTMGLGIAGQLANAGVDVLLLDLPSDGDNRNAICERAIDTPMRGLSLYLSSSTVTGVPKMAETSRASASMRVTEPCCMSTPS